MVVHSASYWRGGYGDFHYAPYPGIIHRWQDRGILNTIYEHWLFQIFIFFCVLFHAINGLRITIVDLFPRLLVHQRQAIWVELAVFIPLFAVAVFVIMSTALEVNMAVKSRTLPLSKRGLNFEMFMWLFTRSPHWGCMG